MSKYITTGTVAAVLAICAMISGAFGKNALSAWLDDPSTTQTFLVFFGSVMTLIAGVADGIKK